MPDDTLRYQRLRAELLALREAVVHGDTRAARAAMDRVDAVMSTFPTSEAVFNASHLIVMLDPNPDRPVLQVRLRFPDKTRESLRVELALIGPDAPQVTADDGPHNERLVCVFHDWLLSP